MSESSQRFLKAFIVSLSLFFAVSAEDESLNKRDVQLNATTDSTAETSTADEKSNVIIYPHHDSPKSNFSAEGRRISEIKCYEYIQTPIIANIVAGGHDTKSGEFPHMGAIGWKGLSDAWVFKCGGSLISSKFVLTAAHCSRASDLDITVIDVVPKIVRLGAKNIIDWDTNAIPTDANILKIIVYPNYKSPKKYYDIALMELENHVVFSKYIHPACLWTRLDTNSLGTKANVTGWGVVDTRESHAESAELQVALVDFIDTATCDRLLHSSCNRNWCGVSETQICAGKLAGGVDVCHGDSGGPLQVQIALPAGYAINTSWHIVVGVTSFGIGCALPNLPGIYSRVSTFLDWIEPIVWSHDFCKNK